MPHAGEELRRVSLNLHAAAAAIATLAALKLAIHIVKIDPQARRQSLKDRHQSLAMRLTGGLETKHLPHTGADHERQNSGILANSEPTVKKPMGINLYARSP